MIRAEADAGQGPWSALCLGHLDELTGAVVGPGWGCLGVCHAGATMVGLLQLVWTRGKGLLMQQAS